MTAISIQPVTGLPEIRPGDDIAAAVLAHASLRDADVVVVSQKIVSKAEGAIEELPAGELPAQARRRIALEQAGDVVVESPEVLIVRTRHGLVCANAGVDASNVGGGVVSLLPVDPDASARRLRERFADGGVDVAVIVADTFGRPWRLGQTDVAIGVAGMVPIRDERGGRDRHGMVLEVTETAVADEVAAAADLVRTKAQGVPVVIVRGLDYEASDRARATDLVRDPEMDLFRRGRGMLGAALSEPWPQQWSSGITPQELTALRHVVADIAVEATGPPARLRAGSDFHCGLAAGLLADMGLAVRWLRTTGGTVLEAGRPAGRR